MDILNRNEGNGMRRQQQLSGKHNYNPQGFEVSVKSDCKGAPHFTEKRWMLSFFTVLPSFLVRKDIFLTNLTFSESSWVTKTPPQSWAQKHRLRTLPWVLRNFNIWALDLPGLGQKRVLHSHQRKASCFWCGKKVFWPCTGTSNIFIEIKEDLLLNVK